MKFAYADPPYLGCGRLYAKHHPEARSWDDLETHRALIARLMAEFPDGWALSMHTPSIKPLAPLLPDEVRWGAWIKPFAVFKPNVNPGYKWEPVAYFGGRKRGRDLDTLPDYCIENITLRKGLTGAKPPRFCKWVCDFLNVQPGDELVDLFPGTGVMGETFKAICEAA